MLIILPNSCLDTIDEDNNFSSVVAKKGGVFCPPTHKLTPHIKGKKMQKKKKKKKTLHPVAVESHDAAATS
jgi:hypothetical protein